MDDTCRVCGKDSTGQAFDAWVKDTFTNYDILRPGQIICDGCLFWFDQKSIKLQTLMGKEKPQKMQNYSHFVVGGEWHPVSKGNKPEMARLLLTSPFPELAVIANSGQKHIAFRARRNPAGQSAGWIQFEEISVWVDPQAFGPLLSIIEELYTVFSKGEIESGHYFPKRIMDFGVERWDSFEQRIKLIRKTILFQLAIFLAQRSEEDDDQSGDGSDTAQDNLERSAVGLQESVPDDHLGSVRKRDQIGSLHQQPGEVYQFDLFSAASQPGSDG